MAQTTHAARAPSPHDQEEGVMGFLDHLDELRSRLIRSCIAVAVGMALAYSFPGLAIHRSRTPREGEASRRPIRAHRAPRHAVRRRVRALRALPRAGDLLRVVRFTADELPADGQGHVHSTQAHAAGDDPRLPAADDCAVPRAAAARHGTAVVEALQARDPDHLHRRGAADAHTGSLEPDRHGGTDARDVFAQHGSPGSSRRVLRWPLPPHTSGSSSVPLCSIRHAAAHKRLIGPAEAGHYGVSSGFGRELPEFGGVGRSRFRGRCPVVFLGFPARDAQRLPRTAPHRLRHEHNLANVVGHMSE